MKEIKLMGSDLVALVDDEDFEKIGHFKWYAENVGHTFYAMRSFRNSENKHSHQRMHREILGTTDRKIVTDHIDHNGLNNQKSNLRACTQAENRRNTKARRVNKLGLKGVSIFKNRNHGMWKGYKDPIFRARIVLNRKEIGLGYFKTPEEAARAYDQKAKEIYGKFAYLNFP